MRHMIVSVSFPYASLNKGEHMHFLWPVLNTSFLAMKILNQPQRHRLASRRRFSLNLLDYSLPKYIWISRAVLVMLLGGSTDSAMPPCLLPLFDSARGLPFLIVITYLLVL